MGKSVFPTRIQQMIESAWENGEDAVSLTDRINNTRTAQNHQVKYTVRQVAAALAWHTIRERYGR